MSYVSFWIKTDGSIHMEMYSKKPGLKALQTYVGGWIELVPKFSQFEYAGMKYTRGELYANDMGRLQSFPLNQNATDLWRANLDRAKLNYTPEAAQLFGNCVFVTKEKSA